MAIANEGDVNEAIRPQGKLSEIDELLGFTVGTEKGNVRIDFAKQIAWFVMAPDLALAVAASVVKHATALKGAVR